MSSDDKPSSLPLVLAVVALLCVMGGCLIGSFSGWSHYQSQRSWNISGLSSEGSRFARRLQRVIRR